MAVKRNPGALAGATGAREIVLLASANDTEFTETALAAQARFLAGRFGVPQVRVTTVATLAFGEAAR